ncbi:MAG: DUF4388 domain-containing protein [Thermodesulfobacteriota bacterium]
MPDIFLGDLSQLKIFDILKPLLTGKKTGVLSIKGKENGEIFLDVGNIVHAKTSLSFGEYAFFTIMSWKSGRITFEPDIPPNEKSISLSTEQLLLNWSSRRQEWEKIREVLPSPNCTFRLSLQQNPEDKNISADQWNVLALSNGIRTISEIRKTLNWDEFKTLRVIYQLVHAGLLEKTEDQRPLKKRLAGENFFTIVDNELKKVIGPVAPFIIDDKLVEFGETRDSLPQDQTLSFVEALSEEIPNNPKRREFVKVVMELLSLGE